MNKSSFFVIFLILFIISCWVMVSLGFGLKKSEFAQYFGHKKELLAIIVSDPEQAGLYQQQFEILPQGFKQKILVKTASRNNFAYGQKILIIGKIKQPTNSETFNYIGYLAVKNIYAQMSTSEIYILNQTIYNPVIYYGLKIKKIFYEALQKNLPKEQSALLIALLVGDKGLLSTLTVQAFSNTGVAHLIAVSSYILTVILVLAGRLKAYLGSVITLSISAAIILLYLIMADFASGVLRAALMFALLFLSKILGKQYHIFPVLVFTAAILVALNPLIIKYDLGFMFSFASIVGIIFFVPLFQKFMTLVPEQFAVREILATTLAAQLTTIPLTMYYFQQLPLVSPLSNLIIVPIVTPTVIAGYFLIIPLLGQLFAKLLLIPLNFILITVYALAGFKYAVVYVHISTLIFVMLYALELGAYFLLKYLSNKQIQFKEKI